MPNHVPQTLIIFNTSAAGHDDALGAFVDKAASPRELFDFNNFIPRPAGLDGGESCDWGRKHWGTKWDAYDIRATDPDVETGQLVYTFNTAWRVPLPVLDVAAAMFPGLRFTLVWNEPVNGTHHTALWENGKRIHGADSYPEEMDPA